MGFGDTRDQGSISITTVASLYYDIVKGEVKRFLSWNDREQLSKTYGCFDRTYWGWKFTDFPGARFQEGIYALAHLFSNAFQGNDLYRNERVLQWARAGMTYWCSIQYSDGSFDEAYPHEHSLAATAFTSFYISEAFCLLKEYIPENERSSMLDAFARAGKWLCNNDEYHGVLSNHLAAAAAALYSIYSITGENEYKKRCFYFIQRICNRQSDEGWYEEYGGADPGYQTHCTFYLAWIWVKTKDVSLLESLERSIEFLKYCIHPNGTLGGEYGSRNTEFYFPAGFEILASVIPNAGLIAQFMRISVRSQVAAGLAAMDSYNFFPMLNNYLFAAHYASVISIEERKLPFEKEFEIHFFDAGLYIKSTASYYCIVGLSKGGVVRIYDRTTDKLLGCDSTYWSLINDNTIISSQSFDRKRKWKIAKSELIVESGFVQVNQRLQFPLLFIGFRLFSMTFGRLKIVARWLKGMLVYVLIRKRREFPLHLSRKIRFEQNKIIVNDTIKLAKRLFVKSLKSGTKFSPIHMGSSRYFQVEELAINERSEKDWAEEIMQNHIVCINHNLPPDEKS